MTEKKNNFEGEEFLEEVLQKLNIRLREIEKDLAEGQKDIESMHEYYWENYAEMDSTGTRIMIIVRRCFSRAMPMMKNRN